MVNYPFMASGAAQKLLVEMGGAIGWDRRDNPVFQFRDRKHHEEFIKAWEQKRHIG